MVEDRKPRRRDLQRAAKAKAQDEGVNYTTALRALLAQEEALRAKEDED